MQNFKGFFKVLFNITITAAVTASICMLNYVSAVNLGYPNPNADPDETTQETEPEPPAETTTETDPPYVTDPDDTDTEPPDLTEEPPVDTEETTEPIEEPAPVKEVQLNFYWSTLEKGEGVQLISSVLNGTDDDPAITYYSNNTAVARVDASGYIIAIDEGTAEIFAVCGNISAFATITVIQRKAEPEYIVLSSSSFTLNIGGMAQIEAQLLPEEIAEDYDFTYFSSDTDVATVDEKGVITAVSHGEAEITVYASNISATVYVNVTSETFYNTSKIDGYLYNDSGNPMAGSIVYIDNKPATVDKDGHFSFDEIDQKLVTIYISDNPDLKCNYTVLKDATIYLLSQANAITMLSTLGELQGRLAINKVSFDSQNLILNEGEVYSLSYTYQPQGATITDISYVSSNSMVVQVGQIDGVITAKSAGEATVTLTVNGGQASVSLTITVNEQESTKYSALIVVTEGLLFAAAAVVIVMYYKRYQRKIQQEVMDEEEDESDLHDIE